MTPDKTYNLLLGVLVGLGVYRTLRCGNNWNSGFMKWMALAFLCLFILMVRFLEGLFKQ